MIEDLVRFVALEAAERQAVFDDTAIRHDTLGSYIEKDFWVSAVLDVLFRGLGEEHPRLLFKGGTSLSKGYGLIHRFSEDIDIVVSREWLGFDGAKNPMKASSRQKRQQLYKELTAACGKYVQDQLRARIQYVLSATGCQVSVDERDAQTLLIEYPSVYPPEGHSYVQPRVMIEAGARSAVEPSSECTVTPYISESLDDGWDLAISGVTVIVPERTYWEKLLILHGQYSGYHANPSRLPKDANRMSRHYYDVALITDTDLGKQALEDRTLWTAVREHNLVAFPLAWKKFQEAVPGSTHLVPDGDLRNVLAKDYSLMEPMVLGNAPDFDWIIAQLEFAEAVINTV